jgi:small nuclear ribonucleoprotein (snRNP)-like protein
MNGSPQPHIMDFDLLRTIHRYLSSCVTVCVDYSDTIIGSLRIVDDNITLSLAVTF